MYLYRAIRLAFRGVEAVCHEHAAHLVSARPTSDAEWSSVGFEHSAFVVCENEDYGTRTVNFRADGGDIAMGPQRVTNRTRATWAEAAWSVFLQHSDCDRQDALGDLLSALMHLALQDNLDLPAALERAVERFEAELPRKARRRRIR